jgi:hypothetical protein
VTKWKKNLRQAEQANGWERLRHVRQMTFGLTGACRHGVGGLDFNSHSVLLWPRDRVDGM